MGRKRKSNVEDVAADGFYLQLKRRLHSSSIPDSLPCRENEFNDIHNFLRTKLRERVGGCMYISGVPGTGKTATVHEVIRSLKNKTVSGGKSTKPQKGSARSASTAVNDFIFVELNGLQLTEPHQAYTHIWQELTGNRVSSKAAVDLLSDYFLEDPDEQFVVLMVDELDVLCTKKQTILYHLFDWPHRPNSNLVVIAIANAMDLPERVMMSRISSRLGLTRLTFQPYTYQELFEIVYSRLDGLKAFDSNAIQLVARKVAAVSGDARRALDICRRATLIAEQNNPSPTASNDAVVRMRDVDQALKEMFSSLKIVAIREASKHEQSLLRSIVTEFRVSGLEEAQFSRVFEHHRSRCQFDGLQPLSTIELFEVATNLWDQRLILIDSNKSYLHKKIRLNISQDDIEFALNQTS